MWEASLALSPTNLYHRQKQQQRRVFALKKIAKTFLLNWCFYHTSPLGILSFLAQQLIQKWGLFSLLCLSIFYFLFSFPIFTFLRHSERDTSSPPTSAHPQAHPKGWRTWNQTKQNRLNVEFRSCLVHLNH